MVICAVYPLTDVTTPFAALSRSVKSSIYDAMIALVVVGVLLTVVFVFLLHRITRYVLSPIYELVTTLDKVSCLPRAFMHLLVLKAHFADDCAQPGC